ncbi:MAG TPA: SgcJ/EcaC family oxidoreductase [Planctomycetota bacterium]
MRRMVPLFLALAAGCSTPGAGAAADERAVAAAVHGMYDAFKAKTLDGVAPYMTESSTCYDVYTSQLLIGRKAVLDHFGAILSRHKPGEKWQSELLDMYVAVDGTTAVATYKVRTAAEGGTGHMLAAVTHVFVRESDGRWRASHLHRSWASPPK